MRLVLLGLTIAVTVLVVGCDNSDQQAAKQYPNIIFTEEYPSVGDMNWYVCWGETKDGLAFVLFEKEKPRAKRVSSKPNKQGRNEGWLLNPDGAKTQLPTDVQLHEIVKGEYREQEGHVTIEELNAFLKSEPKEYTIAALLSFVEKKEQ